MNCKNKRPRPKYQTSDDLDLRKIQDNFPKLTQQVYMEKEEVKQYDGFSLVEPLIDESKEPHKLHLIKKIKSVFGEPWWVREGLVKLGFVSKIGSEWSIVTSIKPNTPEINKILWLCKHCVKVTPIYLKNGAPNLSDVKYSKINLETGELSIIKEIDSIKIDEELCYKINDVAVSENKKPTDTFGLNRKELFKYFHNKKDNCQMNNEYFPTKYKYNLKQNIPGVINLKGNADTRIAEDE